ncbi:hypothetical protein CCYA_CCYA07G2213 [Cyanidiococcus yangmingshanensis]|uniref:Uncharacterized protein n=1 Tax=Cyanidiococcus yangmingshanensis TaxID=2690220 RepID=A0A7J7ILT7_9RHOD|nr:hypothetical protein F1559_004658 [Cyanidiococcus yangmingshanensis]KAK4531356.1 hypothetical protein CCYA_CCYA07G2213 [Cyanidiococcus yangmingshanensis]
MNSLSRFSRFRRVWLKPDVYPLLSAVSLGVAVAGYQSIQKLRTGLDVHLNRETRGKHPFEYIEHVPPEDIERSKHGLMSFTKGMRESIFHADRRIFQTKHSAAVANPIPVEDSS